MIVITGPLNYQILQGIILKIGPNPVKKRACFGLYNPRPRLLSHIFIYLKKNRFTMCFIYINIWFMFDKIIVKAY